MYNDGDVPLSDVTVTDSLGILVTYVGGDDGDGVLNPCEWWQFTASYTVPEPCTGPVMNEATATGEYEGEQVSDTDVWSVDIVHGMGARTIGYWKTHPDVWCWESFPSTESIFYNDTAENQPVLLTYFPGKGAQRGGVNPLEMLRAQLLAAELNVACFDDDFYYSRYEAADIFDTIAKAEAFLSSIYEGNITAERNADDLEGYWSALGKKGQREFRQVNADLLALKDILEAFNAMSDEIFG